MEGPDNDANKNSNSTTSGGIFSTPDLTVDANNLAQPTPSNDKNRIASLFANTKTGRESQRLNDAMGMNNVNNSQPLEGDLVIQNNPKKKSKLPLILLVIVLLAAVIGVVVFILFSKPATEQASQTPLAAFEEYRKYIISGDTNNEVSNPEDWLIYNFADSGMNDQVANKYAEEATHKLQVFQNSAKTSNVAINVDLNQYARLFDLFIKTGNLKSIKQTLLNRYIDNGAETAYNYITEISPSVQLKDTGYQSMNIVSDMFREYLEDELSLIEQYNGWGCIEDHSISLECVYDKSEQSTAYATLIKGQSTKYDGITSYMKSLRTPFTEMTEDILGELRGEYE